MATKYNTVQSLLEQVPDTPEVLVANLHKIVKAEPVDDDGDGKYDRVLVDGHEIPRDQWEEDQFNDLGTHIPRDNSHRVNTNAELIEAFNTYTHSGSGWGKGGGVTASIFSAGIYALAKRKTTPPGHFGHFISSGRHMLTGPGIHSRVSMTEHWLPPIPIDPEQDTRDAQGNVRLMRTYGDKTILQVPENHVAGGFRIGRTNELDTVNGIMRRDGEFVLFGQGRHVLADSEYSGIEVKPLTSGAMKIGPVTVLWIKEGYLGCALEKKKGTYKLFYPGPPYLLHEKDYDEIDLVERNSDVFNLGPFQFVTIKDNQIGGAYLLEGGRYQLLPPGSTYMLHKKDFTPADIVTRTDQFNLGPYHYITVRNEYVAGVATRTDGQFHLLAPGKTYQFNTRDFKEPVMAKRDSNLIKLGPVTILTVPADKLAGAYQTDDSQFVEFQPSTDQYVLHSRDFYGLTVIDRFSDKVQQFGPNIVVTISGGSMGIFQKAGCIEVMKPAFYKLPAEYKLLELVPTKQFTRDVSNQEFKTKDGISMAVTFSFTWRVVDAEKVAHFSGSFRDLFALMDNKAIVNMMRLCKTYTREQLHPTQHDIVSRLGGDASTHTQDVLDELYQKTNAERDALYASLAEECCNVLTELSSQSALGVEVSAVHIDNFTLLDQSIILELEKITKSILAQKEARVRRDFVMAQAETAKKEAEAQAELEAYKRVREAQANAKVMEEEVRAEANAKVQASKAENEANVLMRTADAKAKAESDRIALEAETNRQLKTAEAEAKAIRLRAQAEAEAIKLKADADAEKARKEYEAHSQMPDSQLILHMLDRQVQGMKEFGSAAWKHPEAYMQMFEKFGDKFRFGATTMDEYMRRMGQLPTSETATRQVTHSNQ